MAEGRMLKKRISKSRKFAALKNDKSRLTYLLLLPHTDVCGRIEAALSILKGAICPYIDTLTTRSIAACLKELHDIGLICLYETDGEKYLQVQRFLDFNKISPGKEAASSIPEPTPEQLQSCSRGTPAEVKGSKVKGKGREEEQPPPKIKHLDFVFLTEDEYQKLTVKYGKNITEQYILKLNNYIGIGSKKAKGYDCHYFVILKWTQDDNVPIIKPPAKPKSKPQEKPIVRATPAQIAEINKKAGRTKKMQAELDPAIRMPSENQKRIKVDQLRNAK